MEMTEYIPTAEGAAQRILAASEDRVLTRDTLILMLRIAYLDGQCDLLREQCDRARNERENGRT